MLPRAPGYAARYLWPNYWGAVNEGFRKAGRPSETYQWLSEGNWLTFEEVTGRENLRGLIEQKLDQNIGQQSDSAKVLREELGGNFERLGIRVTESLAETGRIQLERLENVTTALGVLTEKSEKAQESLRLTVEGRLDAIRQDNAVKLDEMRQTVDEKLQGTLEQRLGDRLRSSI